MNKEIPEDILPEKEVERNKFYHYHIDSKVIRILFRDLNNDLMNLYIRKDGKILRITIKRNSAIEFDGDFKEINDSILRGQVLSSETINFAIFTLTLHKLKNKPTLEEIKEDFFRNRYFRETKNGESEIVLDYIRNSINVYSRLVES